MNAMLIVVLISVVENSILTERCLWIFRLFTCLFVFQLVWKSSNLRSDPQWWEQFVAGGRGKRKYSYWLCCEFYLKFTYIFVLNTKCSTDFVFSKCVWHLSPCFLQFAMGIENSLKSAFSWIDVPIDEEMKRSLITAVTMDKGKNDLMLILKLTSSRTTFTRMTARNTSANVLYVHTEFVVCGDMNGNMWFNQPPEVFSWSSRKPVRNS